MLYASAGTQASFVSKNRLPRNLAGVNLLMRSRWILAAATLALLSACSLLSLPSVLLNLRVRKDVTYTPKNWPAPLVADLYTPSSKVPTPAVLLIHGGGVEGKGAALGHDEHCQGSG